MQPSGKGGSTQEFSPVSTWTGLLEPSAEPGVAFLTKPETVPNTWLSLILPDCSLWLITLLFSRVPSTES